MTRACNAPAAAASSEPASETSLLPVATLSTESPMPCGNADEINIAGIENDDEKQRHYAGQ